MPLFFGAGYRCVRWMIQVMEGPDPPHEKEFSHRGFPHLRTQGAGRPHDGGLAAGLPAGMDAARLDTME